ncbi:MAG: site-specific integrase [Thermococcus sp.]|nr:site-specific integrase [Thermococcus sp.]
MSVEQFIEYYNYIGRKIAKPYYYLLRGFEEWLENRGKKIDAFTATDVEMYMAELAKQSPRSANVFLSAIRKYSEWRVRNAPSDVAFVREQRRLYELKGIRPIKVPRVIKKEALSEEELKRLLLAVKPIPELFVATIVHFYFGWRPIEGAKFMTEARINWDEDYMVIKTAKVGNERILVWPRELRPIMKAWHHFATTRLSRMKRPEEWYTKAIKPVGRRLGLKVTARTARKTFETQMRKRGIEQWVINFVLGHTTQIPDVYTDWDELRSHIKIIMTRLHYMLPILKEVMAE